MERAILSVKNAESQRIIKEARKKAIAEGITFSEAVIKLLPKWINTKCTLKKRFASEKDMRH